MAYPVYDDPPYTATPTVRDRARRELVALILMIVGIGGLVVCAFLWAPLAGAAAMCLLVAAVGAWLGYDPFGG